MSLFLSNWVRGVVLLLGAITAVCLFSDIRARQRGAAPALEYDEVRAVCGRSSYPESYFLEMARTMGVAGAVLRPEPLDVYLRSGEVLRFTDAEIRKLRATGVAEDAAPLSPDSLWVKDAALFERLRRSARASGTVLSVRRYGDMRVVEPPKGTAPGSLSAGFDPGLAAAIARSGLLPVFRVGSTRDFLLVPSEPRPAALLVSPEAGAPSSGAPALAQELGERGLWLALEGGGGTEARSLRAALLRSLSSPLERVVAAGEMPVAGGIGALLRQAVGEGRRLLVLRLDAGSGLDANREALRGLLRRMRERGYSQDLQPELRGARPLSAGALWVRLVVGFLLAVFGPILALRQGLKALRSLGPGKRLPEASPFLEALTASAVTAAVCAGMGLAAYAMLSVGAWRLDAAPIAWGAWGGALTLLISSAALYFPEPRELRRLARRPWGPLAKAAALTAAAFLILLAPAALEERGPASWLRALSAWQPFWWWAVDRWRELLIGYPCLFVGFCLHLRRIGPGHPRKSEPGDPRPWLLLGLFAPMGLIQVLARARIPFEEALAQSLYVAAAGTGAGLLLLAARHAFTRLPSPRRARA